MKLDKYKTTVAELQDYLKSFKPKDEIAFVIFSKRDGITNRGLREINRNFRNILEQSVLLEYSNRRSTVRS